MAWEIKFTGGYWHGELTATGIFYGEQWALALTDGNRQHCCIGSNDYQKNFGGGE